MRLTIISIGLIFFLVLSSSAQLSEYVLLSFAYDNGNFVLLNKSLEYGSYPYTPVERDFRLSLISRDNSSLYSTSFDPSVLYSDSGNEIMEGGVVILNQSIFYAVLPNFEEINKVVIVKDNSIVFEEDIHDVGATSCRF